ncbi:alpha/beta hydrolase [Yinghuangia aomiensis]
MPPGSAVPRRRVGLSLVLALLASFLGLGAAAATSQAAATTNPASVLWEAYPDTDAYPHNSTDPVKRVIDIGIHSPSTDAVVKWVRVLLPAGWSKTATRTWPTLWLLHGGGDDHTSYTTNTHIEEMTAGKDAMVVMPQTSKCSSYTNWWNYGDESQPPNWEDYVVDEVSQILESQYRANDQRAVLGISMGGGGAMMLAGKHPGHFKAVAELSGAVNMLHYDADELLQGPSVVKWGAAACDVPVDWKRINGEPGYPFYTTDPTDLRQQRLWKENSAIGNAAGLRGTPLYVYYGNGSDAPRNWTWTGTATTPRMPAARCTSPAAGNDGVAAFVERNIRAQNQDFVAELGTLGIPATVCAAAGQHGWDYWEPEIWTALPMLLSAIGA